MPLSNNHLVNAVRAVHGALAQGRLRLLPTNEQALDEAWLGERLKGMEVGAGRRLP